MKNAVKSNWNHALLVCKKCEKKLDGGFGADGDARLSKSLRKAMGTAKGRKGRVGIIEVSCLGICPKKAVVLIDTRRPGVWRIVQPGADVGLLAQDLAAEQPDTSGAAPSPVTPA